MSGNVWEWVSSVYDIYPYDPNDGRENLDRTDGERGERGGSFADEEPALRATFRYSFGPETQDNLVGFRCARPD